MNARANVERISGSTGRHSALATGKLISNIVAESNAIMKHGHLRPKAVGLATTAPSADVAHSTADSLLQKPHHASSTVNVARRASSVSTEAQAASHAITTATIQQAHMAKDTYSNANDNNNDHNEIGGTSASKAMPEQWNDVRVASHPGLFIVIGVTIGIVISLGLIHLYRCRKPWHRRRNTYTDDDDPEHYTPAHRDLLPMEILNSSSIQYTDVPIDLWWQTHRLAIDTGSDGGCQEHDKFNLFD